MEQREAFSALEQPPIATALSLSREALRLSREQIREIWNLNVCDHFARVRNIMAPHFDGRDDNYQSFWGMPDNGNPRSFVKTDAEMELFYHDHTPDRGYAEWLEMRGAILFAHPIPQKELINRLDKHFMAHLCIFPCDHCQLGMHEFWASRFVEEFTVICPISGHRERITMDNATEIYTPGI